MNSDSANYRAALRDERLAKTVMRVTVPLLCGALLFLVMISLN